MLDLKIDPSFTGITARPLTMPADISFVKKVTGEQAYDNNWNFAIPVNSLEEFHEMTTTDDSTGSFIISEDETPLFLLEVYPAGITEYTSMHPFTKGDFVIYVFFSGLDPDSLPTYTRAVNACMSGLRQHPPLSRIILPLYFPTPKQLVLQLFKDVGFTLLQKKTRTNAPDFYSL